MTMGRETIPLDCNELFEAMTCALQKQSDRLAFLLPRTSCEYFVKYECGWAIYRKLDEIDRLKDFHLSIEYMRHDLALVPENASPPEQKENTYVFEFKMDGPGGLKKNSPGIVKDCKKIACFSYAFVVVFFYAFEKIPPWSWLKKKNLPSFEDGQQMLLKEVQTLVSGLSYKAFDIFHFRDPRGVDGKARLLVLWHAKTE